MKKLIPLSLFFLFLMACKNDPKQENTKEEITTTDLVTEKVMKRSTDYTNCEAVKCPSIDVAYYNFKGTENTEALNQRNQAFLAKVIYTNQETGESPETIDEAIDKFINDYHKFKQDFPESSAEYELMIDQHLKEENKNKLVIETKSYTYMGGAHGYGATHFSTFDKKDGHFIEKEEMITDIQGFTREIENIFRKKKGISPKESLNARGYFFEDDQFVLPENMAITKDSVHLMYNPYEIAAYAEGQIKMVVPTAQLQKFLKNEE
ncbi:DUF3298 and DUF4163 domain-containing protein [Mesonia sp. K7]|uniref:DUF3298 and DUF4163 domain-containing protein n=1 Tax=Mesonia sp. K7 TaxID=2218606 RepID=UPI000DA940A0|nr:DUF3298 and DUF4163 domain-containing protein [Mesonia sp. K7]PZD79010.1 hypothetical protein DNG35_03110 [Mesonia sp. K7]